MMHNPFISSVFSLSWIKNFDHNRAPLRFEFISLPFFKRSRLFPVFNNIGQNHTKGVFYKFLDNKAADFCNKVFLIYDIPEYFGVDQCNMPTGLGHKSSFQYPGYLIDLTQFQSLENFMQIKFSKSTRYKQNKCYKRLHASFNIKRDILYGEVNEEYYEFIFVKFRALLEKRFNEKGIINNNLDPIEWSFYKEVSLPLIREKKACLFVLFDNDEPIGITLNFIGDNILFDAITVFDIDYAKFNLGYINIMAIIDWAIINGFRTLDFSKGELEYKKHWCTDTYNFDYHILYDKNSLVSRSLAALMYWYFQLKSKLRQKKLNEKFHRIMFNLSKKEARTENQEKELQTELLSETLDTSEMEVISISHADYKKLKEKIITFLFIDEGHFNDVEVFKEKGGTNYFVKGKTKTARIRY